MRSSCPAGSRRGGRGALREANRGADDADGDEVWIWRTCCALAGDAGSPCASHPPPERNHPPGGSAAGESNSSAPRDAQLNAETPRVAAGREVSAHLSHTHPTKAHPRCFQLWKGGEADDGECGGGPGERRRDLGAQPCG